MTVFNEYSTRVWKAVCVLMFLAMLTAENTVDAHPGGVDAAGGHVDKSTGLYHFHRVGGPKGKPINEAMKPVANSKSQTPFSPARRLRAARENAAAALLKTALQSERKVIALRAIADLFPDTDSGTRAKRIATRFAPGKAEPPTPGQQAEIDAQQRIQLAQQLIVMGEKELATEILKTTVKTYSKTKAAKKAEKLLEPTPSEAGDVDLPNGGFFDQRMKELAEQSDSDDP